MNKKITDTQPIAAISSENGQVRFSGRLDSFGTADVWAEAMKIAAGSGQLTLDASEVNYLDGSGAALFTRMELIRSEQGGSLQVEGLAEEFQPLLDMYREENEKRPKPEQPHRFGFVEQVGRKGTTIYRNFLGLLEFLGESLISLCSCVIHPSRVRWKDTFSIAEAAGINALPIVILIGFLIGLTIAFQSSIQLRKFGAELFIADMLGLAMFREMGPLTVAILLAGRSGSAFAAEIGTMTINDEIKAIRTMGLSPVRFLAVSRMIAAIAISPVLMMIFNFFAFVGGAVVVVSFGYPIVTYVNRIKSAIGMDDMFGGLFKVLVFGIIVAVVGCHKGLTTGTGASAVGDSTTSAVVTCIVLVGVLDGIFAVVYYALGI